MWEDQNSKKDVIFESKGEHADLVLMDELNRKYVIIETKDDNNEFNDAYIRKTKVSEKETIWDQAFRYASKDTNFVIVTNFKQQLLYYYEGKNLEGVPQAKLLSELNLIPFIDKSPSKLDLSIKQKIMEFYKIHIHA